MLRMWDIGDAECLGCGIFKMRDYQDARCSRGGIFKMWSVGDLGYS